MTKSIRDVYQILRDRFTGKTKGAAFFDVVLNPDNSMSLTATIHGHETTFYKTFKEHESLIDDIIDMFNVIEKNHIESGYEVKYGKPTEGLMDDMDIFFKKYNYHTYFKTPVVKIQITISIKEE